MEDNHQTSGQPDQNSVENQENSRNSDTVAYETYKKVLGEKKRRDSELAELRSEIDLFKQKDMEASGQKDELINTLRSQLTETKKGLEDTKTRYAWNAISSQIKTAAVKQGCQYPESFLEMIKPELKTVQVDDNFNINTTDLNGVLDAAKQRPEIATWFKQKAATVKDGVPNTGHNYKPSDPKEKLMKDYELGKISYEEFKDAAKKLIN